MKTIIMKISVCLLSMFAVLFSLSGQTNLGSYDGSFFVRKRVAPDDVMSITITQPMNLVMHNYAPIPSSETICITSLTVRDTHSGLIIGEERQSLYRRYVYDANKACMILTDIPAGTYEVVVNGDQDEIPFTIQGYPSSTVFSHWGEDMSLAIDLGSHDSDFSYSHLRNTDDSRYRDSYGNPSHDVFYKFTLTDTMYVAVNHWGSPIAAQTSFPTMLYILKSDEYNLVEIVRTGWQETEGIIDDESEFSSLEVSYDFLPEIEDFLLNASAWHGWLEPGVYYVVSETPYTGGNLSLSIEGTLLTNIRIFATPSIGERTSIDAGTSASGNLFFEDCKYFSAERNDAITYHFTLDENASLSVETNAEDVILERDGEIWDSENLSAGTYELILSSSVSEDIFTSIRTEEVEVPKPEIPTPDDTEVCIGEVKDNFIFNDRMTLPEHADTSLNFKFRVLEPCTLIFDYSGSESCGFTISLRDSLSSSCLISKELIGNDIDKFYQRLVPGTYYHSLLTADRASDIYMSMRTMEDAYACSGVIQPSMDKSHIMTYMPLESGIYYADEGNSNITIEYFDGLGRPLQTVNSKSSPFGQDMSDYKDYEFGRVVNDWNSIAYGDNGSFKPVDIISSMSEIINSGDSNTYSVISYDSTPLSRTTSVTGSGEAWHNAGKSVSYEYLVNDTTGVLKCLRFVAFPDYDDASAPTLSGVYPSGSLTVVMTSDEDDVQTYEFTDRLGRHILTRVVFEDRYLDTYYVYDIRNMLRAVIPPAAVDEIDETGCLSSSVFYSLCYGYGYDDRGRCAEASRPGAGITLTVYSRYDYPLFSQTPELAAIGKWKFDIPDIFGRSAVTGICSGTYEELQSLADDDIHAVFGAGPASSGYWQTTVPLESPELHQALFYDDYSFLDLSGARGSALRFDDSVLSVARRDTPGSEVTCKGLHTGSLSCVTGTSPAQDVMSALYYDIHGNVIQTLSENIAGGVSSVSRSYDFQGNLLGEFESHSSEDGTEISMVIGHEHDRAGRLVGTVTTLDDTVVTTKYTYDPLGRLEMSVVTSGEVSDTTIRSYNVRGWQTDIRNKNWSAQMRYNNPVLSGSETSFTGNISEWEWTRGSETNAYSLLYDDLSRITGSRLFRNGSLTEALSEKNISYDSNGNILSLTRTGEDGLTIMDLSYGYDGNRLTSLSDDDFQSQNYAYDLDGNMTFDGRTGLSLEWNDLGLVEKVSLNGEDLVNYSYLADGTKVSAIDSEGNGLLYLGSLIYRKTGNSIELESAGFAGGRFVARETSPGVSGMVPMIHVTDHLGSVRAVVDGISGAVVETNDYYPFGSRWNVAAGLKDETNRFRYNSKEEQSSLYPSSVRSAVSYIDYGARQYDPVLGRWFAQDPLSEKYCSISPYAFCAGNPVKLVDEDGRFPDIFWDIASIGFGIHSLVDNVRSGNVKAAVGDALGVAVDAIAAAVPLIPGGVGLARNGAKAAKAINAIDNAADAAKGAESIIDAGTDAAKVGKYSEIPNPRNVDMGKKFTQKQKAEILQANMEANGGVLRSDGDGRVLNFPKRNIRGQKADMNQAEVDHIKARSKGGSNESNNAQVLSKEENLKKYNK